MAWTAEKVKEMRESNPSKAAESSGWTAEKVRAVRTKTPNLAGNDRDREKLEKKLLALEDADENPLYEEKDFTKWVKDADKKAEKAKDEKNWWEGVK